MNHHLFHLPARNTEEKTIEHMPVPVYQPPHTTDESSEFPGNTIRIKASILIYTEDCIAAGCPEDLW